MKRDDVLLPMSDGVRIALSILTPDGEGPWPVVFEARPYRKDDITPGSIDERLASEGRLVVCRADVRGTGTSEGVATDEYAQRELDDHVETIAWLASQPWSTGSVGMYGTSYSGFNSLQVAALQPPALKAIIPIFATDRRYTDDVHYGGGVMRGIDFLDYPIYMIAMNALPPVPSIYGESWREEWLRRIEANEPWVLHWLDHQNEDGYWRHGSVWHEDGYDRIEAATMIVAGHADGYHNMAFRGFQALRAPKRLLFGPWSHMSPRLSMPGPRIDHVPEMIRWWGRWLRGDDNGVDREPPIVVFARRPTHPAPDLDEHKGEWRAEPIWPPARLAERRLAFGDASSRGNALDVRGDVGVTASIWCAASLPFGLPWDQRADEIHSLVYDWEPGELEIMGHPRVELAVSSTTPVAFVSAKLCDVFPDGTSALVSRGILNLTHRSSHAQPEPVEPGTVIRLDLELDATAWIFEPGHRVRLDLAGSDFPSSWPPPDAGVLTVDPATSTLVLPALEGPPVATPPSFAPGAAKADRPERVTWEIREDLLEHTRSVRIDHGGPGKHGDIHTSERYEGEITVRSHEPGVAFARGSSAFELTFPEATVRAESRGTLSSDADTWRVELELDVLDQGTSIAHRRWERVFPRNLQ